MKINIHGISAVGRFTGALQCHGPRPRSRAGILTVPLRKSDALGLLGAQDLMMIAVKTPSLARGAQHRGLYPTQAVRRVAA